MKCNIEANMAFCSCSYEPCERKGKCCECVQYHRKMNQIPGCFFTSKGEKSYDRSFKKFMADCKS